MNENYRTLTKPCAECPFRRRSAPGWLGPWKPNDLLQSLQYFPFPCHRTIGKPTDDLRGCAGAAIYMNNDMAISRCRDTAKHQQVLKDSEHSPSVFARRHEFMAHHDRFGKDAKIWRDEVA